MLYELVLIVWLAIVTLRAIAVSHTTVYLRNGQVVYAKGAGKLQLLIMVAGTIFLASSFIFKHVI